MYLFLSLVDLFDIYFISYRLDVDCNYYFCDTISSGLKGEPGRPRP